MGTLIDSVRQLTSADVAVMGLAGDNPQKPVMQHQDETRTAIRAAAIEESAVYIELRTPVLIATDSGERWAEFHASAMDCHPNDKGHRVWAEAVASALIEIEIDQEAFV
jgi:lysophospholipase L1-like esterase